jgi:hypothetical protein
MRSLPVAEATSTTIGHVVTTTTIEPSLAAAIDAGLADGVLCVASGGRSKEGMRHSAVTERPGAPSFVAVGCEEYISNISWQLGFWDGGTLTPISVLQWDDEERVVRPVLEVLSRSVPEGTTFDLLAFYAGDCRAAR